MKRRETDDSGNLELWGNPSDGRSFLIVYGFVIKRVLESY
jgi:hypothetical protein